VLSCDKIFLLALEARKTKQFAKDAAFAQFMIDRTSRRDKKAYSSNELALKAAARREVQHSIQRSLLMVKANRHSVATTTRCTLLQRGTIRSSARAEAVAAKRAALATISLARDKAYNERVERADQRRTAILSYRIARAKMSALSRVMAVKLTASDCGVEVKLMVKISPIGAKETADGEVASAVANIGLGESLPEEIAVTSIQAFMRSKEARKSARGESIHNEESACIVEGGRSFFGRIIQRMFGI